LDDDVEVAVIGEDAGIEQSELGILPGPLPVPADELVVRELSLRILVERLHVGVRRRRVEEEVLLLDVLAVVPLLGGQAEQALPQDGVYPVPEAEREAQPGLVVADAQEPVLAPAVGP